MNFTKMNHGYEKIYNDITSSLDAINPINTYIYISLVVVIQISKMLAQFLINGFITGLLYSLGSLGFALVYNTTRIFHIALAVMYVAAAYFFWELTVVIGFPVFLAILSSAVVTAFLSLAIERYVYFPLVKSKGSLNIVFISSIAVFIVLTNLISLYWGNESKIFSTEVGFFFTVGDLIITGKQAVQFFVSISLIVLFFLSLNLSKTGLRIKALRDDVELYQLFGFSLVKIRNIIFFASGLLIAAASCLNAWDVGMNPNFGMPLILNGIVALIIGGIGRFESCIIGGVILGLVQSLIVWQWSSEWVDAVTFLVLLFFLLARPQGFIGEKSRMI